MIAIIESGSTKANWIFTDGINTIEKNSIGMNPFFIDVPGIKEVIEKSVIGIDSINKISKIYFFGSGCSGFEQKKKILDSFKSIFTEAEVLVDHDTMGAVLATCGNEAGISCIIGTGSNSVYFDGKEILPNNYGLGFILADEGAGTYLGKKIVTSYLYGLLPKKLSDEFKLKYNLTREEVLNTVYNKPMANAWLASFALFFAEHKSDPWVVETVKDGFIEFAQLFVMNYPNYQSVPVHFIGSIAFHYKSILKEVADGNKFTLGKIIQKPIDGLAEYYIKKEFDKMIFQ